METIKHTRHAGFDPSEYVLIAEMDAGTDSEPGQTYWCVPGHRFQSSWDPSDARCAHCGKPAHVIRYSALFEHIPSGDAVWVGHVCGSELDLPGLDVLFAKKAREAAQRRAIAIEAWLFAEAHQAVVSFLHSNRGDNFADSLLEKLLRYGNLTDRQVAAVEKWQARETEFVARKAAEPKPEQPLEPGRRALAGEIVSTKWVTSDFGETYKMLVRLEDGNKVWGTVPQSRDVVKGQQIRFTATVETSGDDEHFGFFKRPAKSSVLMEDGTWD